MAVVQAVSHSESKMSPHGEERADATRERAALLDASAFSALYLRYADRIFRHCDRRLGSREAAEDATGLVFAKALGTPVNTPPDATRVRQVASRMSDTIWKTQQQR
jgi:DNA-directed RNA polymerase specialized sigma24 family protein